MNRMWLLTLLFATTGLQAATPKGLDVGLSMLNYQMNKLATDDTGKTSQNGTNFYHLDVQYHAPLSGMAMLSPLLRYMPESLSAVKAPDGGSKSSILMLGLPVIYNLTSDFDLGGGLALTRYTVHGSGGTVELNNGTSHSTFALPGETVTSTTVGLLLGGAYFNKVIRGAVDFLVQAPFNSERRTLSIILSVTTTAFQF